MDTSSRNSSGDRGAVMAPPIAEFEVVRVTHDIVAEGYNVPKYACGTVVAVYDHGATYAVEIADLPGGTEVLTLRADQIERTH
jgi:Domain of unknown function (DUF4926)